MCVCVCVFFLLAVDWLYCHAWNGINPLTILYRVDILGLKSCNSPLHEEHLFLHELSNYISYPEVIV